MVHAYPNVGDCLNNLAVNPQTRITVQHRDGIILSITTALAYARLVPAAPGGRVRVKRRPCNGLEKAIPIRIKSAQFSEPETTEKGGSIVVQMGVAIRVQIDSRR